jgi:hypothetical protein
VNGYQFPESSIADLLGSGPESRPVPLAYLCDPANWSYVSEPLEPMTFPLWDSDSRTWMMGILAAASRFRYRHRLNMSHPLAALASPWLGETGDPYRGYLARNDIALYSFGVERPQFALIVPDRFRYFDRGDGHTARFTLPAPGALVDITEGAGPGDGHGA